MSLIFALLVATASFGQSDASNCQVQIDGVEWFFKANNPGFGPANVKILHQLTADFLSEIKYGASSDQISTDAQPEYTHRLTVDYHLTTSTDKATGIASPTHSVVLQLEKLGDTGGKHNLVVLAKAPFNPKLSKRKQKEEISTLYDLAEETYFRGLKKFPPCK